MFNFDENYSKLLDIAWKKFINSQEYDYSSIRPEILESWKRSRAFSVDPIHSKTTILTPEELNSRINSNLLLLNTARPYMEKLYSIVEGSSSYLLIADKDGYILDMIGDKDIIEKGKDTQLVIGANRSERYAGTNAIGTCLELKKPIQMWDGEHYVLPHKEFSCSSAPIFDSNNNLLGCLNITGSKAEIHTHTLGMVSSAADGITKELKIRKINQEIEMVSAQRNIIIETISTGLILLDEADNVIQINKNALSMLNFTYEDVIGKNLFDLISIDDPNDDGFHFSQEAYEFYNKDTDIYYKNSNLPPVKFNMSTNFVKDSRGLRTGTVIRLNEPKLIHKLVNKISGYQSSYTFDSIIGSSPAIRDMIDACNRVAKSSLNVLILGESGTGKELVAQSIHNASKYANGPFVAINCGALPKGLIESELFGYERGSFTGANKEGNPGKFELADGGTIFLDEVGDMPLDVQVSLLRVLQTKEIIRIGGKYPRKVNVRIIAATNRDLETLIEAKTFREDLYYRLNVFSIQVPPLRDRKQDIIELANHFIDNFASSKGRNLRLSQEVSSLLIKYPWYGNVRELENAIERAVNITDEDEILFEHLPKSIQDYFITQERSGVEPQPGASIISQEQQLSQINSDYSLHTSSRNTIIACLMKTKGNVQSAAAMLGISRRTLYRKMEKYKINYQEYRN
ncbi:MAG: sigma-54-dependent Fis family transcriptional regulator [Anaerovoracaceae bacterium]